MNEKIKLLNDVQDLLANEFGMEEDFSCEVAIFSTGILDSMDVLKLIVLLEKKFNISVPIFESSLEMFDTMDLIVDFIIKRSK
jgi:acyl carrier protein